MTSLYERLGGESAIEAAVVRFYEKVMADPEVSGFFESLDMKKQISKQIDFMTLAFGGPNEYSGRDLRVAHSRLVREGLGDRHFDKIATHLEDTLRELAVPSEVISEVMAIVGSTRGDVLNR